ncbi:hypothetical protein [Pseudomonas delhiensis]|uniref:DUF2867 domain-containing protein n=1 Tax=Pseudomonas delhiensis TaxID=366289 RepID=A0A239GUW9_9PSED|nr:hypothetical protein [Pseudomonas delhiensis]SDK80022.1 hypothetical protein SAMN05216189_105237 [Pseudomonas delhiensis]SNS72771.1 hypothetical protein SAMN06295949_10655 [Pseudomonas delhiensis]
MNLADRLLPSYQFSERHHLRIAAPPGALLDAVATLGDEEDPLVQRFLRLREAPARLALRLGLGNALAQRPRFGLHEFSRLGRDGDEALALGLVGRFWRADFGLRPCPDAEAFRHFAEAGCARLLLYFHCEAAGAGDTWLHTETRVHCPDLHSRLLFTPYWLAIRPVSGLIRRRLLQSVRRRLA